MGLKIGYQIQYTTAFPNLQTHPQIIWVMNIYIYMYIYIHKYIYIYIYIYCIYIYTH